MNKTDEIAQLNSDSLNKDNQRLFTTELIAHCGGNAFDVLEKTKQVLKRVIDCELLSEDSYEDWHNILPFWFVERCVPELSIQDVERLRRHDPRFELGEQSWSVEGFVYSFRPEERSWYWFNGLIKDPNILVVQVLVEGFPFAIENLVFLLEAAGAQKIERE
jgi:hypothetical protein